MLLYFPASRGPPDARQSPCFHRQCLSPSLSSSFCSCSRQWHVWVPWAAVSVGSAPQSGVRPAAGPSRCSPLCLGTGRGKIAPDFALASTPGAEAWPACLPSPGRASWPWCGASEVSSCTEHTGKRVHPLSRGRGHATHTAWATPGPPRRPRSAVSGLEAGLDDPEQRGGWGGCDRQPHSGPGPGLGGLHVDAPCPGLAPPGGAGRRAVRRPSGVPPARPGEGAARSPRLDTGYPLDPCRSLAWQQCHMTAGPRGTQ